MGLFSATETKIETVERDYAPVLIDGERVLIAFKAVRDLVFLTNLRLCTVNVQGLTGRKVEIESIPYRSIVRWSIERAGTFDMDADLLVWISGSDSPLEVKVAAGANIVAVQQVLARHILGSTR
ncbi:PH domain-containing protein [Sphingomonas qomolangmaensis]|uniref:PH domain-containing protein n=1 Tax=Sphingomonas qomolangmaensis TaxID=2918765 RepID=A0ABY5L9J8_9SPHN|nr:PH domain-containing protein [Sphingomonas qomolangmaensis]UUL82440.1 PH domain-containing protein [Sphingomonas qomolangmaensis]